ncbi:MAG: VTT domain-containing protein [Acidobacteria bacterium]|nr:VTT domain-containing protein [Acidobacteriota bacterium]
MTAGTLPERVGRIVNYLWVFAVVVVFILWLREPDLFARESIAARIESWGPWMFAGFIGISLARGFFLVPSTPVILAGGVLFPESLPVVFVISVAGIVVSATAIYYLPGLGGYDNLLERRYPHQIARMKRLLATPHAFWVVAGWSFFPLVPTDVICYAAGLLGMSYRRMVVAVLLGEMPLVLTYLLLTQAALTLLG